MKRTTVSGAVKAGALAFLALIGSGAWAASATRTSSFEYDATSGLITKEVIEPDDSNLCLVTTYTYDAYGNKTGATTRNCNGSSGEAAAPSGVAVIEARASSSTFASGSVVIGGTTYNWSAGQFPTTGTNALSHSETKKFDSRFGAVVELTGPNSLTTTWSYDSFGRKTLETRADGTKTEWAYIFCSGVNGGTASCPTYGKYLVQTTPKDSTGAANGPVSKVYYDALNREIRTETQGFDGTLVFKDTQYDSLGRVAQASRPYKSGETAYWTVFTYDILGRVLTATEPATTAGTIRTANTYNGLTTTVTVSNNGAGSGLPEGVVQTKVTTKNSQGQTVEVKDTLNNTVAYTYDPFGNLLTTNAGGVTTTLEYDLRGRKTKMTDPDMGIWTYKYNALGELVWQCDPVSRAIASTGSPADCTDAVAARMAFDKLGRITQKTERDLVSKWFYDSYPTGAAEWESGLTAGLANNCAKGMGKPCYVSSDNAYRRLYTYDSLGRTSEIVTRIDSALKISYAYHATYGQVETVTYPTGFVAKNVYNARGYLQKVTDGANTVTYWQATSVSASGKVLTETLGNGLTTTRGYDVLERMTSNVVGSGGGNVRQYAYTYDTIGNVTQRQDVVPNNVTENLAYDKLNRLTSASGSGLTTRSFTYSAIGNIATKSDVGTYTYPSTSSARPHAVSSVSGSGAASTITADYGYDANGNLTTASGTIYPATGSSVTFSRTLTYMSFNMPASIAQTQGGNNYSYAYTYNADHERVKLVTVNLAGTFTTVYLHPAGKGQLLYEKETKTGSTQVEHKNFIQAGAMLVGVYITRDNPESPNPATEMRYFHKDHLGSVVAITNSSGAALERLSFEAFGERRLLDGTAQNRTSPQIGIYTDRGYTAHEHLDEMNLIHMNGRIYDPALGRFMTSDPFIQMVDNLQDYNRYSYVNNNPYAYTDPSGYLKLGKIFRAALGIAAAVFIPPLIAASPAFGAIAGEVFIGSTFVGNLFVPTLTSQVLGGVIGGFAAGAIGGGSLESGLQGAITGGLFAAVGSGFTAGTPESYIGHAGVGCLSGVMGGGGCGRGAASAIVGKFATNETAGFSNEARFVVATVAGGTASAIGGGKFENGAVTAAFGYLFNQMAGCRCGPGSTASNPDGAASLPRDREEAQAARSRDSILIYRVVGDAEYNEALSTQQFRMGGTLEVKQFVNNLGAARAMQVELSRLFSPAEYSHILTVPVSVQTYRSAQITNEPIRGGITVFTYTLETLPILNRDARTNGIFPAR